MGGSQEESGPSRPLRNELPAAALRTIGRQGESRWSFLPSQRGISSQSGIGYSAAERKAQVERGRSSLPSLLAGAGAEFGEIRAKL